METSMVNSDYTAFLQSKKLTVPAAGITVQPGEVSAALFPFQRQIVLWLVRKGRGAVFADVGLGKTIMQVEWARLLNVRTLFIAPLAVTHQTVREAQDKLGVTIRYISSSDQITDDCLFYIINYEMLHHINPDLFQAVALDDSSILKNMTGVTKKKLVDMFQRTPYRSCWTATPAPNDVTELGSHAEFLGVMRQVQMTSVFFIHEAGVFQGVKESRWRLKRHAKQEFYRWLASWSVALRKPSDIGFSDEGYVLPKLNVTPITVASDYTPEGMLPGIGMGAISATDAGLVRRQSIVQRAEVVARMVNGDPEQWIVWTGLNDEANHLAGILQDSVNVHGSMNPDDKSKHLMDFVNGKDRVLISKSSIAGMGMNMQQCHKMIFFGINFSWEDYYQSVGRILRFGQKAESVDVYVVISEQERPILNVIEQKGKEAQKMVEELIQASKSFMEAELQGVDRTTWTYREGEASGKSWRLLLGDSCERLKELESDSVHLSVYSPPFSDMYVYNNTPRDLSNSMDLEEFFQHYAFIIRENMRVTLPGRIACVHVQDPKTFKNKEGYRGLKDFTGQVIDAYTREGWIFRSRITIDKNPQIVASRNKDNDLLFVTGKRDSTNLAPMATDYLLVFKKPGDNPVPVTPYANGEMTEDDWISWAHAVWYDIRETDVLNVAAARADDDSKHMCPLQLPLIARCLKLWSNPGELILSPFAGIGSELYEAVRLKRRGVGIELKPEYHAVACRNLAEVEQASTQIDLFTFAAMQEGADK
jgi:DNA modification methylase